jgi:hypothetical protein
MLYTAKAYLSGRQILVYTYLYDTTVAWYMAQRYSAGPYVHLYAVTTLSSMALVNLGSLVAMSAYWKAVWASQLIAAMDSLLVTLVGAGLLAAHLLFSRWRRRASASRSESGSAPPSLHRRPAKYCQGRRPHWSVEAASSSASISRP